MLSERIQAEKCLILFAVIYVKCPGQAKLQRKKVGSWLPGIETRREWKVIAMKMFYNLIADKIHYNKKKLIVVMDAHLCEYTEKLLKTVYLKG